MCSRFWGVSEARRILSAFEADGVAASFEALQDRKLNTAPTETVFGIVLENGKRVLKQFVWGLTVAWQNEPIIHLRSETALEKPTFADATRNRRLIVPAEGFFEWRQEGKVKQPYFFKRKDGQPIAMGGIWKGMNSVQQCAVMTTEPNELVSAYHNRMPVILHADDYDLWLGGSVEDAMKAARIPYPAELMECYPVTRAMSRPMYMGNDSIEPLRDLFDLD